VSLPTAVAVGLDAAAILLAARAAGWAAARLGQPRVIGEIAVGVALGPTLLGDASVALFPEAARQGLQAVGQLGLILFMFLVGLRFDVGAVPRGRLVVLTGAGSALVPFVAGAAVAPALFAAHPPPAGVGGVAFALYLGVGLSITAFPVLARILIERGLDRTPLGNLTMGAAAINDLLGWCLLAIVLAVVSTGGAWHGPVAIGSAAALTAVLLGPGRRLVAWLLERLPAPAVALGGAVGCAAITDAAGTHVIFGAFLFGLAWPRARAVGEIRAIARVLMPIFFALPGLALNLRALDAGGLGTLAVILAVAIVAKVAGATGGAWLGGLQARSALTVGALMNTRGLMELIVLNLGYELGVLDERLYAVLLVMAIATTVMTDPLLRVLNPALRMRAQAAPATKSPPPKRAPGQTIAEAVRAER
jgi:Kef-type K+ transport system membrane component KefB